MKGPRFAQATGGTTGFGSSQSNAVSRARRSSGYASTMPNEQLHVDWDSIETPLQLLNLMLTQAAPQAQVAAKAGRQLMRGEEPQEATATLLQSAAIVADFLWPSPSRRRPLAQAFPRRGEDLRHLLGVNDQAFSALDRIRNDFVHVDERLEALYLADPNAPLTMWGSGPSADGSTRVFIAYDRDRHVVHSLGSEVDVAALCDWLDALVHRIGEVWLPTMIRGGRQRMQRDDAD